MNDFIRAGYKIAVILSIRLTVPEEKWPTDKELDKSFDDAIQHWHAEKEKEAFKEIKKLRDSNSKMRDALILLLTSDYSAEAERFARNALADNRGEK